MKKKPLTYSLDLMKSALDTQDWSKAKRYGETVLKKLYKLSCTPLEEYLLYCRFGMAYSKLAEYSRALDSFYKANLIATKNNFSESYIAYALFMLGWDFVLLKNFSQALVQFKKVDWYYQKHGYNAMPMDRQTYMNSLIGLGYCYLGQNNSEQLKNIIDKRLPAQIANIENNVILGNYHHLKGEYFILIKECDNARIEFDKCVELNKELALSQTTLEAKIHLATIDLLDNQLDSAIETLEMLFKNVRRLKFKDYICKVGILLGKCYELKGESSKAIALEKIIKPFLRELDIIWLYEKTREFEQLYRQLQNVYKVTEPDASPRILAKSISRYQEEAGQKDIIIGKSTVLLEAYQLIEKVAPTDLPVLIQGETGTGKELIARNLHYKSLRKKEPWLALNCSSLPETLLENELFGHVKGAFTDAQVDQKGYIERASGGTLFLDEIADMSPSMQQKLLRVLEEKQVWRLGSTKPIPVNTRFIFASNQNVEELVTGKRFREDLYYRINTIVIALPPLRERKEDIPLLIEYFLKKYASNRPSFLVPNGIPYGMPVVSPDALSSLQSYNWPGNIRELENEIKRIITVYPNIKTITEDEISKQIRSYTTSPFTELSNDSFNVKELRKRFEADIIRQAIKKCNGNLSKSARILGYTRTTLYQKMKQFKIAVRDNRG